MTYSREVWDIMGSIFMSSTKTKTKLCWNISNTEYPAVSQSLLWFCVQKVQKWEKQHYGLMQIRGGGGVIWKYMSDDMKADV